MRNDKEKLAEAGRNRVREFCTENSLPVPAIEPMSDTEYRCFRVCGYYRPQRIVVHVPACAALGYGGRAWSWPGYTVDRTPFGVYAHELGHHIDWLLSDKKGRYCGDFGINLRAETGEPPMTNYCDNDAEWFAENFRLFVTNPDLLRLLRPKTYARLEERLVPVETRSWGEVLRGAPYRTIEMAVKKIKQSKV